MTPVFAVYSLMVISIDKEVTEMNLDIDRVIRLFFSPKYICMIFYIGWD